MAQPTNNSKPPSEAVSFKQLKDSVVSNDKFHLIDDTVSSPSLTDSEDILKLALASIPGKIDSPSNQDQVIATPSSDKQLKMKTVIRPTHIRTPLDELFNYNGRTFVSVSLGEKKGNASLPERRPSMTRSASFILDSAIDGRENTPPSEEKRAPMKRSFSEENLNTAAKSSSDEPVIHSNPVFGKYKHFDAFTAQKRLSYLLLLPTKYFYDVKKAEQELSEVLKEFPEHLDIILKLVLDVRKEAESNNYSKRVREVLILALLRQQNLPFLFSYFDKSKESLKDFASEAVAKLIEKKEHRGLSHAFSSATFFELFDAKTEVRQSLFRGPSFSSYLGKEYGTWLLNEQLKRLDEVIVGGLKHRDLSLMHANRDAVVEKLKKKSGFNELDPLAKEKMIDLELKKHVDEFAEFAHGVLEEIYKMQFPADFRELLTARREHIIEFLKKNPLPEEGQIARHEHSRPYLSELLFLRILNPHITLLNNSPDKQRILIQLSKVVQGLANEIEIEFGDPKIFQSMNALYLEFIPTHRKFVDEGSKSAP